MHIIQTRKVLCEKLGICDKTLRKITRAYGIPDGVHLKPLDLEIIATKYGTREGLLRAANAFK